MATSSIIHLTTSHRGVFAVPNLTKDSANTATRLLQANHEKHHIFFNEKGFHNHIAHHILTAFALGASPELLQRHYDDNASYQRPPEAIDRDIIDGELGDSERFRKYLGDERYYRDYLIFFQKEMDRLPGGFRDVVKEYLLKGDERADDLLGRLYNGILHPIIHLGFGIEFEQPAIIAEALAQAAVHESWLTKFLLDAEQMAAKQQHNAELSMTLVQLHYTMRVDENLSKAPHWEDGNKLRDGVFARAYDEMVSYASRWRVGPENLEQRTAEMCDFTAFVAGAAQKPSKAVKFDFFHIHSLNCSIFFAAFLRQDWLSTADKIRLLEWKGRVDLAQYARCGLAKLDSMEIREYKPVRQDQSSWDQVIQRVLSYSDDGHASKLVRALASGAELTKSFEQGSDFRVRGEKSWLNEANMAIDSVEADGPEWVRSCGYDQAWEAVPSRSQARL